MKCKDTCLRLYDDKTVFDTRIVKILSVVLFVKIMMFNATFNNISVIADSFIGGGNRSTSRKTSTCHKSLTTIK